ncbi:MAG: DUF1684 domain-containing protein [Bacteroidota bacterium]
MVFRDEYALLIVLFLMVIVGCREEKRYHDKVQRQKVDTPSDALQEILDFQAGLNREFRDPETSPLPDRYRKSFEGLDFFAPDTAYRVRARLVRTPEALPFLMPTTTDRTSKEVVYGIVTFSLHGKNHRLEIYQNPELILEDGYADYLFLPFTDRTNGDQTYMGGRYLDLRIPKSDTIVLDFNKAYNPYCVYNKKYSCPLVHGVNALGARILAGVKDFEPKTK